MSTPQTQQKAVERRAEAPAQVTKRTQSSTTVHEIADGIYRISTPVPPEAIPGGFTFNQYLIVDDEPLLFHTGLRGLFPAVREAIGRIMPVDRLRHVSCGHVEADECDSLNQFLRWSRRRGRCAAPSRPWCRWETSPTGLSGNGRTDDRHPDR